ncbi:MAG: hypothetical protein U1E60_12780 [Reyranellaceae bacterium]
MTLRARPFTLDIAGTYNVRDPKVAERGLRRTKHLYSPFRPA